MKANRRFSKLWKVTAALGSFLICLGILMSGFGTSLKALPLKLYPAAQGLAVDNVVQRNIRDQVYQGHGVPHDWSHHHLVFSNPGTEDQAIAGNTYSGWLKIVNDPRFILEQVSQNPAAQSVASEVEQAIGVVKDSPLLPPRPQKAPPPPPKTKKTTLNPDWSTSLGVGGTVGTGMYPAKFSLGTSTASCSDFVVFNTGLTGSSSQATIAAFSNLYTGCTGGVPSTYWAYNTGSAIAGNVNAVTSTVLSYYDNGQQVAFVQNTSTGAQLVLLKWSSTISVGSVTVPTGLTTQASGTAYRNCTAPCMLTINFSGAHTDTNSPPFVDYSGDNLYVGDDNGSLHQFTGVFVGTPAENTTSPWPVSVSSGNKLTGPIFDYGSGKVFVADSGTGAKLHSVTTAGAVLHSAALGTSTAGRTTITDAPLVDESAGTAYVFVANDASATPAQAVYQFSTGSSLSGSSGTKLENSSTGATQALYIGAFDNLYYTSSASSRTGYLYVCLPQDHPRLWQISITNGTMAAGTTADVGGNGWGLPCSPVTELLGVNASTTLSAAITTTGQTSISLTSGTNFPNTDYIQIDSEIMKISSGGGTNTLTVSRAQLSTTGTTHSNGAAVYDIHDRVFFSGNTSKSAGSVNCNAGATAALGCVISFDVTSGAAINSPTSLLIESGGYTSGIIIDNQVPSGTGGLATSQIYFSPNGPTGGVNEIQLQSLVSSSTTSIPLHSTPSGTAFATGHYIRIDSEIMLITGGGGTTTLTVTRAQLGTTAAAHVQNVGVVDYGGTGVQASQVALQ